MANICGPVPFNPDNIEPSIINEKGERSKNSSDFELTINSFIVLCIMSSVKSKPTGVVKLSCDQPKLTWGHINNIRSRPLTSITVTEGHEYSVTCIFLNTIQDDVHFHHCLYP